MILVPVVLGVERLNEVYSEQLRTVLQWKQSVGIVGGRPGHSYYFLGYQVCSCCNFLVPHSDGTFVQLQIHTDVALNNFNVSVSYSRFKHIGTIVS